MTFLRTFLMGAIAFAGAACGNTVVVTGSGSGGTTSATTSGTTGHTTVGTTSNASTSGSGGACSAYGDQKGTSSVVVRFVNQSGTPIYLPSNCGQIDFDIHPTTGGSSSYVFDHSCLQTCHDLQTAPPIACGACAPTSFLLAPGATHEVTWDGTHLVSGVKMPSSCYLDPQPDCSEMLAAPSGAYTFDVVGYSSCGSNCTCDASGICNGLATGQQATLVPVQSTFPGQPMVDLVFQQCAFPCPNP